MQYRRTFALGATYFFTLNLLNKESDLLIQQIHFLKFAFKKVQQKHPFYIDAIVIMPNHWHMIMTLPENDGNYSMRLSLIKSNFSRQIIANEYISLSRQKKRERGIWQRRYWEHLIRDTEDYEHHINYIHYNPVKHGYVNNPSDWPYSSIHRFIKQAILPKKWAYNDKCIQSGYGE
ncbi:REP-associated tyrosine transposase [Legionella cardiaca]|uniref:Transposase n=1 Tax=Legionella cardiaca TaxID=1071983 RepID=A0ABY8AV52_9GAMM|nr:transposase [Legionella cardiaca]WED43281.1 transposase [Legionella cardiaca]